MVESKYIAMVTQSLLYRELSNQPSSLGLTSQ
jgi:hypothetical protein